MGSTPERRAAWVLTLWVEDGRVRGRVASTLDVTSPRSTTTHLAGVEPIVHALRAFLAEVERPGPEEVGPSGSS